MLKQHHSEFQTFQKIFDALTVALSWLLSYFIRFEILNIGRPQQGMINFYLTISPLIAIIHFYFLNQSGVYLSQRLNSRSQENFYILKSCVLSFMTSIFTTFFIFDNRISRVTLVIFFILNIFNLITIKFITRKILKSIRKKGKNLRQILLVGSGDQTLEFAKKIHKIRNSGIIIKGWIDPSEKSELKIKQLAIDELSSSQYDAIIIGYAVNQAEKLNEIIQKNYNDVTPFHILPDLTYSFVGHKLKDFHGIPIVSLNQPNFSELDLSIKRALDFFATLIGGILISPLLVLIALLVKFTSKGPIFYSQERMGLDGSLFKMWKFRSMRTDADDSLKAGWSVKNDSRVTKIGAIIRKTSLDELPQLWNVLTGDMSLVGPRPERPQFVSQFKNEIPSYMLRHKMRAGMTGWAQVNGWRGDTSLEKRIECDIFYIRNWSLWMDIKILFLTLFKGFVNKNAY